MRPSTPYTSIGGQAVIEGVMMKSPRFVAVAVRKPDGGIVIRSSPYKSWGLKFKLFKKPFLRGIVVLIESMVQGIRALSYSAQVAVEEEAKSNSNETADGLSDWAIAGSIFFALVFGVGLFVVLPHFLTALVTSSEFLRVTPQSPLFHFLDGLFKMGILLLYVYCIALMKDVRRVFQYHGAEHKAIYNFESGNDLSVVNSQGYSTLHPRCGTSFLLFLVLISVAVFSFVFPLLRLTEFSSNVFLNHLCMVMVKVVLMLPVAGIAYEFIKVCAFQMERPLFRFLIWPGLWLQKLTTKEPSDDQVEIALASLMQVLKLEKQSRGVPEEVIPEVLIPNLAALGWVQANVAEFPET